MVTLVYENYLKGEVGMKHKFFRKVYPDSLKIGHQALVQSQSTVIMTAGSVRNN